MKKINYKDLNSRQMENYNFHKLSAILADYGYTTLRLSDDWQGADCIAVHLDGSSIRIQIKGRFWIDKKYAGKDKVLWMAFPYRKASEEEWFLFPHDALIKELDKDKEKYSFVSGYHKNGIHHSKTIPEQLLALLRKKYKL